MTGLRLRKLPGVDQGCGSDVAFSTIDVKMESEKDEYEDESIFYVLDIEKASDVGGQVPSVVSVPSGQVSDGMPNGGGQVPSAGKPGFAGDGRSHLSEGQIKSNPIRTKRFRSCTARCNYLTSDRPDIPFATKELCRAMSSPEERHELALKRL